MSWGFEKGAAYVRRRDIHERFGGQRQGGIITPADHPIVICVTGDIGEQFGYHDGWEEGVFRYSGEGQRRDMDFVRGNRAIRDHVADGKDLLVFEKLRDGRLRFLDEFVCAGHDWVNAPDLDGADRRAIVFNLVPIENLEEDAAGEANPPAGQLEALPRDLAELRRIAREGGAGQPAAPRQALTNVRRRSAAVRAYVLARAIGVCESCEQPAPFNRADGSPYLEPHHIRRLSDGGPDLPEFVGAVCPNCHREIHFGVHGGEKNAELQDRVLAREAELADR